MAISPISAMRARRPVKWTGRIAFVRDVISASIVAGSMFNVSSTSAKTGVAPLARMALAVASQDNGVVMTSSPAPMPSAFNPSIKASVPDPTPMP